MHQFSNVMVVSDPGINAQVGWTMMCDHDAIISDILAFLPLMSTGNKTGLVCAVGVDKAGRGKGVGLVMLVKAFEDLKGRGIEGVFIDFTVLEGFYEKFGFEIVWEYEKFVWEEKPIIR